MGLNLTRVTAPRTRVQGRVKGRPTSWVAYLFLLPTFVFILSFSYYPAVRALIGAFTNWDGFNPPTFVGFSNFIQLFQDTTFIQSLGHVLIWTVVGIPLSIIPPFVVSEMIFHLKGRRTQYAYRTLFILAMVVPGVVSIILWTFIYEPTGILNQLLGAMGLSSWRHAWLGDPNLALGSLILMGFPWVSPFNLLILYAGLQAIPAEVLEAAAVDGVTTWGRIFRIDIPLVVAQIKLLVVLGVVGVSQNILTPLLMTGGGPGTSTVTPVFYMYQTAIDYGQYGYGMAIAFLVFLFVGLLAVLNMKYIQARD